MTVPTLPLDKVVVARKHVLLATRGCSDAVRRNFSASLLAAEATRMRHRAHFLVEGAKGWGVAWYSIPRLRLAPCVVTAFAHHVYHTGRLVFRTEDAPLLSLEVEG